MMIMDISAGKTIPKLVIEKYNEINWCHIINCHFGILIYFDIY